MMRSALDGFPDWIVSGSMCGWGDVFMPRFELVIFLSVPTETRLRRLTAREGGRYGLQAIAPGGERHEAFIEFMAWTAQYDDGAPTMRSRAMHEAWMAKLACPVLRLEATRPLADLVAAVDAKLAMATQS